MKTNTNDAGSNEAMTNEEVNRYIHVEIMGKCPHDDYTRHVTPGTQPFDYECKDCHLHWDSELNRIPQYTSDASPRSLLNEVEHTIGDYDAIAFALTNILFTEDEIYRDEVSDFMWLSATAEQIARAVVEAHKSAQGEK